MVCFYSIYLLIMYFNPRIEAWLYKITKTTSPEFKSDLHASNGKNNGYSEVPTEEEDEAKVDKDKTDNSEEEKTGDAGGQDVEKGTSGDETGAKDQKEAKQHGPFEGNNPFIYLFIYLVIYLFIFWRYFYVQRENGSSLFGDFTWKIKGDFLPYQSKYSQRVVNQFSVNSIVVLLQSILRESLDRVTRG